MCTLIIGQNVVAPNTVVLAGNRDEDPARPSRAPAVLLGTPRLVGGADGIAGGTWMAVRQRRAAVAMLNRWREDGPAAHDPTLRSRGLLALALAGIDPDETAPAGRARSWLLRRIRAERFAPFNVVFASPSESWAFSHSSDAQGPIVRQIRTGWHVLTHRNLDDPDEPRAATLKRLLDPWRPRSAEEAREGLIEMLASHEPPRVCIHAGRMVTVSSFVVWLARFEARYHHLDGRPCERPLSDYTALLDGPFDTTEWL